MNATELAEVRSSAPVFSRRVVILAQNLRVAGGLSVGRNILASLARVAPQHEYLAYVPANCGYESLALPPRTRLSIVERRRGDLSLLWFEWMRLPQLIRRFAPDIVWGLGNYALAKPSALQAILFHQPYLLYDPREQKRPIWKLDAKLRYVDFALRCSLPQTQVVFCQTQTAMERLTRKYRPCGRVALLPNAVSRFAVAAETPPPDLPPNSVNRFKLLCLTRYYPHKNLETLVDTFEQHREALRDVAIVLTIGADQMPQAAALLQRIGRLGLGDHIINVGPVQQSQLPGLYRACDGLILPTVLESFSGTYLEAMQFDRPILTSDMDFAREICGDAAVYFDPFDTAQIRDCILDLKGNAARRTQLVAAGRRRAEQLFRSWDDIVRDAINLLMAEHARRTGGHVTA